jgi:hypothetical protein
MKFKLELDKRFKEKAKGRFGQYQFEVGILQDKIHKLAQSKGKGLRQFKGGPARKIGSENSSVSMSEVSRFNTAKKNYLVAPFHKRSSDLKSLVDEFFKFCSGRSSSDKVIKCLQAVVLNPIIRGDYGHNKQSTIRTKGFDRYLIDTGQLFSNIKARVWKQKNV